MRITESSLRRFIRKVISESIDGTGMSLPTSAEHANETGFLDNAGFYGSSSADRMFPGYHYDDDLRDAVLEKAKSINAIIKDMKYDNYHLHSVSGAQEEDTKYFKDNEIANFCKLHEINREDFVYICEKEGCYIED